jgi:hypothetical protein
MVRGGRHGRAVHRAARLREPAGVLALVHVHEGGAGREGGGEGEAVAAAVEGRGVGRGGVQVPPPAAGAHPQGEDDHPELAVSHHRRPLLAPVVRADAQVFDGWRVILSNYALKSSGERMLQQISSGLMALMIPYVIWSIYFPESFFPSGGGCRLESVLRGLPTGTQEYHLACGLYIKRA